MTDEPREPELAEDSPVGDSELSHEELSEPEEDEEASDG